MTQNEKQVDAWGSPVGQAVRPAPAAAAVASSANLGQMVNDPWAPTPSKPAGGNLVNCSEI
jgi:hypothetical protein